MRTANLVVNNISLIVRLHDNIVDVESTLARVAKICVRGVNGVYGGTDENGTDFLSVCRVKSCKKPTIQVTRVEYKQGEYGIDWLPV